MGELLVGTTLLASFLGGVVALLAPCCVSVMLPAYLATGFRHRGGVVPATLVFGAGVATLILPIGLGATALSRLLFGGHLWVFSIGGVLMIVGGVAVLAGWSPNLPMPGARAARAGSYRSAYLLGVFSGAASACCAPVLAGVAVLSGAAASFPVALAVGVAYVAGMVTPLAVVALIWDARRERATRALTDKTIVLRWGAAPPHPRVGHRDQRRADDRDGGTGDRARRDRARHAQRRLADRAVGLAATHQRLDAARVVVAARVGGDRDPGRGVRHPDRPRSSTGIDPAAGRRRYRRRRHGVDPGGTEMTKSRPKTAPPAPPRRRNGQNAVRCGRIRVAATPRAVPSPRPWWSQSRPSPSWCCIWCSEARRAQRIPRAQVAATRMWRVIPRPGPRRRRSHSPPVHGKPVSLSDYRGRTVLLYFQEGLSCQPCWDQIGDLEHNQAALRAAGVDAVVSITTDRADLIGRKAADEKLTTPVLSDPDLAVSRAYDANQYGMMGDMRDGHSFVLVGPDGVIRWRADYGGAPKYTMFLPTDKMLADLTTERAQ